MKHYTITEEPAGLYRVREKTEPAVYSRKEAARKLQVAPTEIDSLIEEGTLQAIDVGLGERHCWRIKAASLEALEAKRRVKGAM